ncbi:MAG: PucR family transcriptional regulator ligand-binding domain-containing protein [Hespellia sp.]|nr:PucR family transcriptional regulator ligand-binding domain-containing protein [Hespellia sp.]
MSLTLQEIYENTKSKYHLNLLTPLHTLKQVMNWVYIGEDITTFDYLNGGELVITTGLCIHNPEELYDFIRALIQHECCGLIINTGGYLKASSITSDIRQLCVKNDFALFTMPWEVSFQAITKDYYNRIFQDNQTDTAITESFLSILRQDQDVRHSILLLEEYRYTASEPYCMCVLNYRSSIDEATTLSQTEEWQKQLLYSIDSLLHDSSLKHHVMIYKDTIVFICCDSHLKVIRKTMEHILNHLKVIRPRFECRIGIGSLTQDLTELAVSYKRAVAALTMAEYHKTSICTFEEMGFFRLLLSVHDQALLHSYLDEQLGTLMEYDQAHNSNYMETLYQYIMCGGSIQSIAAAMYCHRNTVNYRVRNLKEMLGCDIDDTTVRFDFLTAFCIKEYLEIL